MNLVSVFCFSVTIARALAFSPATSSAKKRSSQLFTYTTQEITALSERSPCLPFLLRPQRCKGYVGDVGFDPANFSSRWSMEYLREAELKHGRVCMLAWTGWVAVDLGARVYPVPDGWADINSLAAHDAFVTVDPSDPQGWWASPLANLLYAIAIPELYQFKRVNEMMTEGKTSRAAGDLGWDYLGYLKDKSQEDVDKMKLAEIKHARLGMMAFSGVVAQSIICGHTAFPYISH
mmetsp:Transcript_13108/g.16552  ORF Transcript_13108/g.16552 Transcript_13108/m.16552 type:complete len:234 (-) Transcript_13108:26-727(-)|eukprot:CAMPEP_0172509180 /NCGR_PEP_ID=MMETSP1066-20121228/218161_1 /TAXON_ID=671091 /ORGANISM="Coscinodiscus wailesii, Strain CCMP2513" /LENGTH=233 /DNA_ID=CAMNT_0013287551 /DNA_START=53 /DNA_END=754 /DNA_ORIENTATION=+